MRLFTALAAVAGASAAFGQIQESWVYHTGAIAVSSVRFVDLNGDGIQEIVLATMGPSGSAYDSGFIYAIDLDGNVLPGFPIQGSRPFTGTPSIADLEGDGDSEIIATAWYGIHVFDTDGSYAPGWPRSHSAGAGVAPALADLDGDDDLEIIVAEGSSMAVYHHDGSRMAGWPQQAPEMFHAATVADVDGDGEMEIVAGTRRPQWPDAVPFELYMWNADGSLCDGFPIGNLNSIRGPVSLADLDGDGSVEIIARTGDKIHVFDAAGAVKPGWPVDTRSAVRNATTGVADLDQDGDLEILIGGYKLFAYHHDGTEVAGFPATIPTGGTNINSGPVMADLDGNGSTLEILQNTTDHLVGLGADGTPLPGFPYLFDDDSNSATTTGSPVIGDPDADGQVEFAFVNVLGSVVYFDRPESYVDAPLSWPTFNHDNMNTGYVPRDGCPPDLNGDGIVNTLDFLEFLNAYNDDDPIADFNADGVINTLDFLAFLNAYNEGC